MTNRDRLPRKTAAAERLVVQLAAAINTRALYAGGHPRVAQAIESLRRSFAAASDERDGREVTLLLVGDDILLDHHPLHRAAYQQSLVQALRRRGVENLTLARGLQPEEWEQFLGSLAAGGTPVSTAHVIVGRVDVGTVAGSDAAAGAAGSSGGGGEAGGAGGAGGARTESAEPLARERIERARQAFVRLRRDRAGGLAPLAELVWDLIEAISRPAGGAGGALPMPGLTEVDDRLFVHSVNVALLVLAQGRSLAVQGPALHTLGLAALLHDVGKLGLPPAILGKPGRLGDDDWKAMMSHVDLGAQMLCALDGAPPLAALVAYEHHLRYDGRPSFPALARERPPNLASQLTALADAYDTVRALRSADVALEVVRERAGTFYDPFLAGRFVRLFSSENPSTA
jgi:hypothetical protein